MGKIKVKGKVNKKRVRKRRKLKLIDFILLICIGVLIVSVCGLSADLIDRIKAKDEIKKVQEYSPINELNTSGSNAIKTAETLKNLKVINEDIVAWIDIPETDISMPVVQCSNNDYYLYHSFTDDYTDAGAIFVDWENSSDFSDQNTVIYGHARIDGTMFAPIRKYRSQSYYKEHPFITIVTETSVYYYQIFSANTLHSYYDYRSKDYGDRFLSFISTMRASSNINSSAPVDEDSKILTLSTCTTVIDDGRFALFAVLLNPDGEEIDLSDYPL